MVSEDKEQIKQKLLFFSKSFREIVETNLYNIFSLNLLVLFCVTVFTVAFIFGTKPQSGLTQIGIFYPIFLIILVGANFVFIRLYVPRRIVSRIEQCPSRSRYDLLILHKATSKLLVLGVIVSCFAIGLHQSAMAAGSDIAQNFIIEKAFSSVLFVGMSTFLVGFMYLSICLAKEKETQYCFEVAQDFENIRDNSNQSLYSSTNVWKFLMRQIVYATESTVRDCLKTSETFHSDFYKPFNTISLAAILGNDEEKKKAKERVAELGNIVTKKNTEDTAKTGSIIEHLEQMEKNECFHRFRLAQEKYGFQYDFEHGWKKARSPLGKRGR